jgi:hypothetical protein
VRARSFGSHPFAPGIHRRPIDTVNFVLDSARITVAALLIAFSVTASIVFSY